MTNSMSEEQIYALARKRATAKRSFRIHLLVYVVVNAALVLVWAFAAGRGFPWFVFPLGGWGIGVVAHYFGAYGPTKAAGQVGAAVEREAERIRREQKQSGR